MPAATVRTSEIARFDALAARWWDPDGPMRPLHRMNPARIAWIAAQIAAAFPGQSGLAVLDVGCGAGLAAEALAARGFDVLGIDAAPAPIAAAQEHARERQAGQAGTSRPAMHLAYRVAAPEDLMAEGRRFPVVTALEVIEHAEDPAAFVGILARLLAPGGLLVLSTLNRTAASFAAAKIGAEYLLRWLPVGTHDWRRFVTPVELAAIVRAAGLRVSDVTGLAPAPLARTPGGGWRTGAGTGVNYLLAARG
ncbi:MAG: bifunctional 2-polyprenyl-6-hydroxyphenol methylase/3-demethylubiquinol 3-O-methyltransferase UbiG [Rhodospirillales bacterium]|jgi:2-polyprenyl-6-hydroxyphenyl methylase/3-demethylubiquinone-9 3-methyltransferase|nr:bifunctional 2-polyprenyl-6-hydroxyphenol methylase/3-demethylubiquinol 3-O-methyltransferase UbiG [Rhodospirillales bacterium]